MKLFFAVILLLAIQGKFVNMFKPREGGNLGDILVQVCEPVSLNLPHSYT